MKKILSFIVVAILLVSCENFAHAAAVQIYDYSVDNIISNLKTAGRQADVAIWGTEYYTYKGARRCELHFGSTQRNLIRFRLNNDDSVSRILVTLPNNGLDAASVEAGFALGVILRSVDLSEAEFKTLWRKYMNGILDIVERNPYATHIHEKYSVWCSRTQRYITLDVEVDESKLDYYLYASI